MARVAIWGNCDCLGGAKGGRGGVLDCRNEGEVASSRLRVEVQCVLM